MYRIFMGIVLAVFSALLIPLDEYNETNVFYNYLEFKFSRAILLYFVVGRI